MMLRVFLAIAALTCASAGSALAQCITAPELELSRLEGPAAGGATRNDRLGRMVAPVMVNGAGPFRFIVDTGANRSVVSENLASRLGLPIVGAGSVHTVHGETGAQLVQVQTLNYGDLTLPGDQMPMLQGAMLAGEQGLLGVDGMQGRRLRLDFDEGCIEIVPSRGARPLGRGWTRLRGELRFGHLVVVPGRVAGTRVNVLLDTGANVSLANPALQRALRARVRTDGQAIDYARAYTAGEPIVLDSAIVVPDLDVGALEFTDILLYVGDFHIFNLWGLQNEPTILLGMDTLVAARGMAIDYGRSTVYFQLRGSNRSGARLDDLTLSR